MKQLKNIIQNEIFMRVNWIEEKLFDMVSYDFYETCENLFEEETDENGESEPKEVFEFYAVSDYLFDELKKVGAVVCDIPEIDLKVWGRCETGQSLEFDHDLNKILKGE